MARTRGGGVFRGVSSRSRRSVGKPSRAGGTAGHAPPLPSSQAPAPTVNLETGTEFMGDRSFGRRTGEGQLIVSPPERRGKTLLQPGGSSHGFGDGSVPMNLPTDADEDDVHGDILGELFGDVIGEDHSARETAAYIGRAPGRDCRPAAPVRKSPLSPPKTPVWRMLYVDPDVSDPKLVAGLLEKAASRALRCDCVFDVATDIVEALADVRGDTMWAYRGVFINESLYRQSKTSPDKRPVNSIQGKHLSQFLRQVGMSGARIVLLVAGDVNCDTADAGAHGLSAVLRKPFTKDGFCDVLRGMYRTSEPAVAAPRPSQEVAQPQAKSTTPYNSYIPSALPSQHQSLPSGARPRGRARSDMTSGRSACSSTSSSAASAAASAAAASAAAAAAAAAATMNGGPHVLPPQAYPECLGFAPFPQSLLNRFQLVTSLLRPGQTCQKRKYTKIAPREEDEGAAAGPAKGFDGPSLPDPPVAAASSQTMVGLSGAGSGSGDIGRYVTKDASAAREFPSGPTEDAYRGM